jgi:hypothetical protein
MVRVYGATFGDVTDRDTRLLGLIYGGRERDDATQPLIFSRPLGVLNTQIPWWSHYPRGRVLAHDDFEGTLKWGVGGGTVTKASDATFVHDGTSAMKMVTGAVAGQAAFANLWCTPIKEDTSYVAMEFWWALSAAADATPRDFQMTWTIEDQWLNIGPTFGMRYYHYDATVAQRKLMLWSSGAAWATISGGSVKANIVYPQFNHWLLVLSRGIATGYKYEYFEMNDLKLILTGTPGAAGSFSRPAQHITMVATTDIAAATTAYVDDFVLMDEVQLHL